MTGDDPRPAPASGRRRRPTVVAAALLVIAAGTLWGASRMTWVSATSADGLGIDRALELSGARWVPALTPFALALLAAVAAAFAVRGLALRIVAIAVAAVAVAAVIPAIQLWTGGADPESVARVEELPDRATVTAVETAGTAPLLVVLGAVLALCAAIALWRTPRESSGLSSKYDAPAARREAAIRRSEKDEPVTERVLWDALDAGEDPTVDTDGDEKRAENGRENHPRGGSDGDSGTPRRTS